MTNHPENADETRRPASPETAPRQEPTRTGRPIQPVIAFPPGDLDDLIFHDSYPIYHSER